MIQCANCESAQFVQIVRSRIFFDGNTNHPQEVKESYECTLCGGTGTYTFKHGQEGIVGDIEQIEERPKAA